jgi:hypothetical protein
MNLRFPITFGLLTILATLSGGVAAQQREREREPGRWVGKLKGAGPGLLQVESEQGERWLVSLAGRIQDVSFQGIGTPALLRPGMLVQFSAAIDKRGEAQEEVAELKLISQRMGIQLGAQPSAPAAGGLFASEEENAPKKKKGRAEATSYHVTGTVRSIKDDKLYVVAGALIKVELADNCQVIVDVADISLAREGDSVEIEGWRYPNQPNQLYPQRLVIVAEKPLGVEEKRRRPTKGGEKKEDEEPPAKADPPPAAPEKS